MSENGKTRQSLMLKRMEIEYLKRNRDQKGDDFFFFFDHSFFLDSQTQPNMLLK